ncbi:MAG: anthranilate synthase component I family protein [Pirellulales bacterium]
MTDFPLCEPLPETLDAEQAWLRLIDQPHVLFLDSATRDPERGAWSFVVADPYRFISLPVDAPAPLDSLRDELTRWSSDAQVGLPPFSGGAAGVFSYELGRSFERLPRTRYDEFGFPALAVGFYDVVLAFDHVRKRGWIVSQGVPESSPAARRQRATARRDQFLSWLQRPAARVFRDSKFAASKSATRTPSLSAEHLAPRFAVAGPSGLTSNFSRDAYCRAVERSVEYVRAGDVFQVNLSQRLLFPAVDDVVSLYQRLRSRNPAPFASYFDCGEFQIASASPERFVRVRDRHVEARPIKGTRRRSRSPEADLFAGDELQASEKDRAENVMIVDLLRNDLSIVCQPQSVHVSQLCGLEVYEFVQHLVSVVQGTLRDDAAPLDLLSCAFPGGSITGAPKVRAMEIIAELEPTARGPYCGSLGYLGFDGSIDLNILIRTITAGRGWWQLPVGGGIVAQSDPRLEYEETWHKAAGLLRALLP